MAGLQRALAGGVQSPRSALSSPHVLADFWTPIAPAEPFRCVLSHIRDK